MSRLYGLTEYWAERAARNAALPGAEPAATQPALCLRGAPRLRAFAYGAGASRPYGDYELPLQR
jgi:hypothetical protein